MIKRYIWLMILVVASASLASAQQLSQFTYFTYNYLNYNPAVTVGGDIVTGKHS